MCSRGGLYHAHGMPCVREKEEKRKEVNSGSQTYISWPASLTFANCFGKLSIECAGTNHVALMLNRSQSFSSRSTPTVAPYTPRDTFVGFCGEPSQVLIQFATASTSTRECRDMLVLVCFLQCDDQERMYTEWGLLDRKMITNFHIRPRHASFPWLFVLLRYLMILR